VNNHYDVLILGSGPGGYVCAIRCAQLGLRVAVVEAESLGGVCLNWGCIPTKALLKSAELFEKTEKLMDFGIHVSSASPHLLEMVQRSRQIAAQLSEGVSGLMRKNKVEVLKGWGRLESFFSPFQIGIEGTQGLQTVTAKHVVLATGARPKKLPFLSEQSRVWTSKEALTVENIPESIVIIGAGAIGIEFASFYCALGSKVTVLEQQSSILPAEDREISRWAKKALEKRGIQFRLSAQISHFEENDQNFEIHLGVAGSSPEILKSQQCLMAIGVTGNVERIGLEKTQVQVERGSILLKHGQETHHPFLYAIGDVAGAPWLAHKASHEGVICAEQIAGKPVHPLSFVPGCTYSDPQIASVGYTQEQLEEMGRVFKAGRFPFSGNGQAMAQGAGMGWVKILFDSETGQLLGAHMVGQGVTELIHSMALAMTLEATEEDLKRVIFPHPTLSEMLHEAILDADLQGLHQ
jgi:dihydrolipoamide dehydrogenase